MSMSSRANAVFTSLALALLASCSPSNPHPSPSGESSKAPYEPPPAYAHHSFVWEAPEGVDLLSPEMVAARAFMESTVIMFNPKAEGKTYPGFNETIKSLQYPPDPVVTHTSTDVRGTDYLIVLSSKTVENDTTILVCWDETGTAQRRSDGKYEQGWSPHPVRFTLRHDRLGEGPSSNAKHQGVRPAPAGDVLHGWSATQYLSPLGPQGWDSYAQFEQYDKTCWDKKHGPTLPLDAGTPAVVNPDDPQFAPKPAYPGWPAADGA